MAYQYIPPSYERDHFGDIRPESARSGDVVPWQPDLESGHIRYGHLADEALQRNAHDVPAALDWLKAGLRSSAHHYVMTYLHPGVQPSINARSIFGADIIKQGLRMMQLREHANDRQSDLPSCIGEFQQILMAHLRDLDAQHQAIEEGEMMKDLLTSGMIGEWSALKSFENGCGMPAYTSNTIEDTQHGKTDIWVAAGQSEYDGFADLPDLAWAVQVKSIQGQRPLLVSARHLRLYLGHFSPEQRRRLQRAADAMMTTEKQHDNVDAYILFIPSFNGESKWHTADGQPTIQLMDALEQQVAGLANKHQEGLTISEIMQLGIPLAV